MFQQLIQVTISALLLCAIVTTATKRADPVTVDCVTHMTIDGRAECVRWEVR